MEASGNVSTINLPAIKAGEPSHSPTEASPLATSKKFYRVSDNNVPVSLSPKLVSQLRLKVMPEEAVGEDVSSTRGMDPYQKFNHKRLKDEAFA